MASCLAGLLVLLAVLYTVTALSPIIFVPGYGTSTLVAKISQPQNGCASNLTQATLWPTVDYATSGATCWLNNMKTEDAAGLSVSVVGFGSTEALEVLTVGGTSVTYLKTLVDNATGWGYERNKTIAAAPYDFRRSPAETPQYFANLKNLVEDFYKNAGNQKATLIGHSFGNLMTVYFLTQTVDAAWRQKYIQQYIAIAPLFGGAVEFQLGVASGWDQFASRLPRASMEVLRDAERTYSVLPVFRPRAGGWDAAEPVVITPTKNYTLTDTDVLKMYSDLGLSDTMFKALGDNTFMQNDLDVPVHCLIGTGLPAPSAYTYGDFPPTTDPASTTTEDGDGIVTTRSANLCTRYSSNTVKSLPGLDHVSIVSSATTVESIHSLLPTTIEASASAATGSLASVKSLKVAPTQKKQEKAPTKDQKAQETPDITPEKHDRKKFIDRLHSLKHHAGEKLDHAKDKMKKFSCFNGNCAVNP